MQVYVIGDREQPMVQACIDVLREEGVEIAHDAAAATVAVAPRLTVKLGAEELAKPKLGTLIFHPSLLPRHRGPDSIKWAFKLGEKYSGATWFWADDGLDTGDVCEQEVLAIAEGERPREFYDRAVIPAAARLLRYIVKDLGRGVVRRRPQQPENATYESWSSSPRPDADLRIHPPRGPRVMLGGLYFLARTIDKVRAKLQGTLGYYKVGPGISEYLFHKLGVSEAEFTDVVRRAKGDDEIVAWVRERCDPSQIAHMNENLLARAIRDQEHFDEVLPRYPVLREHSNLRNWFEIFDVDDVWTFDPANAEKVKQTAPS